MAFSVKDPEADKAVRQLARIKGVSLTEAIRLACRNELAREAGRESLHARLRPLIQRFAGAPKTGRKADKKFFGDLSGEI